MSASALLLDVLRLQKMKPDVNVFYAAFNVFILCCPRMSKTHIP